MIVGLQAKHEGVASVKINSLRIASLGQEVGDDIELAGHCGGHERRPPSVVAGLEIGEGGNLPKKFNAAFASGNVGKRPPLGVERTAAAGFVGVGPE